MNQLSSKKIILGITGSIAAYKSAMLCRLLVKEGAEVQVIMSESATEFISPLTLSTLSKRKVIIDFFEEGEWSNHVHLGQWADFMLIAPLTANTLGKMCSGMVTNMLEATYLSLPLNKVDCFVAPAMDLDMYQHPATQSNLTKIKDHGVKLIDSTTGELASGLHGKGRLAEPEEILKHLNIYYEAKDNKDRLPLSGKKVMITAGPTRESIDPVRFISNRSTGTMGVELAKCASEMGAEVNLILGPNNLSINNSNINIISVESAQEMYEAASHNFSDADLIIFAAAVSDYRPKNYSDQKIKKDKGTPEIILEKTRDIAGTLGPSKSENQFIIGFALETQEGQVNAKRKLSSKNFDAIVLNSLVDEGAGYGTKTNKVTIFSSDEGVIEYEAKPKSEVAQDIIDFYLSAEELSA